MITTAPQNLSAVISENVTFTCVATSNRAPNITWIRQDRKEFFGKINNHLQHPTTLTSTLTLTNLMSNDFTNYSCLAENTAVDSIVEDSSTYDIINFTLYEAGKFVTC